MPEFLNEYIVLLIAALCWCICFIAKKFDFIDNKYLPVIAAVFGVVFNVWNNGWMISPSILLQGLVSGIAASGIQEGAKAIFSIFANKKAEPEDDFE